MEPSDGIPDWYLKLAWRPRDLNQPRNLPRPSINPLTPRTSELGRPFMRVVDTTVLDRKPSIEVLSSPAPLPLQESSTSKFSLAQYSREQLELQVRPQNMSIPPPKTRSSTTTLYKHRATPSLLPSIEAFYKSINSYDDYLRTKKKMTKPKSSKTVQKDVQIPTPSIVPSTKSSQAAQPHNFIPYQIPEERVSYAALLRKSPVDLLQAPFHMRRNPDKIRASLMRFFSARNEIWLPESSSLPERTIYKKVPPLQMEFNIQENLPPFHSRHTGWNSSDMQIYDRRTPILERPSYLMTQESDSNPRIVSITTPIDYLEKLPGYPDNLIFRPGDPATAPEDEWDEYCYEEVEEPQPGPSNRPPPPPVRKIIRNKFRKTDVLPVPTHHTNGYFRKIVRTLLTEDEKKDYFESQRVQLANEQLLAREIFEAYRENAIEEGNVYYNEWQRRELLWQKEVKEIYKWDLKVWQYLVDLKLYSKGVVKNRPKPVLLANESKVAIIRKSGDTPPDNLRVDKLNDWPTPPDPPNPSLPFVNELFIPYLWKRRNNRGPTCVPGGYLWFYYDVLPTGEVYRVEEFEYAHVSHPPRFTPPQVQTPMPPVQHIVKVNRPLFKYFSHITTFNPYLEDFLFLEETTRLLYQWYKYEIFQLVLTHGKEDYGKNDYIFKPFIDYMSIKPNPKPNLRQRIVWFLKFSRDLLRKRYRIMRRLRWAITEENVKHVNYKFRDLVDYYVCPFIIIF